ncbi:Wzz/FepE/Etk N-terminal domain-containing protein [Shewanella marina]|uniref:Wzz/FepE/Etk N-terminal domain-containing protein n=1 Tax=Shewanella marina TaxID=487319 RepID=UPI000AE4C841|nr:Wzz/FepE/Etk N-terminal domain-containing protein [Shewanella marina]
MTALVSKTAQTQDDVIDLGKLFGILIDNRWMIIIVTMVFAIVGVSYALLATPVYKADALVQVEKKSTGMPALVAIWRICFRQSHLQPPKSRF